MLSAMPVAQSGVIRASAVVHAIGFAGILAAITLGPRTVVGQTPSMRGGCPEEPARFHPCALAKARTFSPPRTPDGKPDLQGFWMGSGSLSNIEEHPASTPDVLAGGDRGGRTLIVEPADGKIPYQPWALAQRKENVRRYIAPLAQCLLPGVPRQMHSPGGFQIIQRPGYVVVLTDYVHSYRVILSDGRRHVGEDIRLLQGDSRGRWEANTLVVDVTNIRALMWFDWAGNFYSDAVHVIERLTLVDRDTIHYEALIDDPKVFTRPWKMAFGMSRRQEPGYEAMEEACYEGDHDRPLYNLGYETYRGVVPPR